MLDLGCGIGTSVDYFRAQDPEVQWTGLDLADSREVAQRTRTDARFASFDGVTVPFADESFDLVYCKQVLEHVRHPAALLTETRRVLRAGGAFAGSTSQLEPYHRAACGTTRRSDSSSCWRKPAWTCSSCAPGSTR